MHPQVSFIDGTYLLIHIPLEQYSAFLQPILRILLPQSQSLQSASGSTAAPAFEGLTSRRQLGFLNISVTPIECSVVCHSAWWKTVFEPILSRLPKDAANAVSVSSDYLILSVISAGLDAAGRVMELTSPLALAGIPIFFISTYFSDFILVPVKERQNVIEALIARGFELSENQTDFVSSSAQGQRRGSSRPASPPKTPPPSDVDDLQARAFDLLTKRNVVPRVDSDLVLVQCSGRETSSHEGMFDRRRSTGRQTFASSCPRTWVDDVDTKLYTCMVSALALQPRFISITLAQDDPPSLLLDRELLGVFGDSLAGDTEGSLIPIFLDLVQLPLEISGIVCGVAGKLVQDMQMTKSSELSYLSTARAGAVILPEEQSVKALGILTTLLNREDQADKPL